MGEGVGHDIAARLLLQPVVADRGGRLQCRLNVARLDRVPALVGMMRPHPGIAVGLQFDPHLDAVCRRLAAGGALRRRRLRQNAEQVLHVVADLMRDHIGLGELASLAGAAAEAHLHVAEERRVEINAPVVRAVERPHRGLRKAAAALLAAGIEPQPRRVVLPAAGPEYFAPGVLGIAEHGGDELAGPVARHAGPPRRRPVLLLVLRAAADDLRAADQNARVDAGRPADQAEYDRGSDADAAARNAESAAAGVAAAAAVVLDIIAAAKIIPTHLKRLPFPWRDHY